MDYRKKYLKYKTKYLDLKNKLYGGDDDDYIPEKIINIQGNTVTAITKTGETKEYTIHKCSYNKQINEEEDKRILPGCILRIYQESTDEWLAFILRTLPKGNVWRKYNLL